MGWEGPSRAKESEEEAIQKLPRKQENWEAKRIEVMGAIQSLRSWNSYSIPANYSL